MSSVMFYEKPVLLNRTYHKGKKVAPSNNFSFASKVNSLYLAGLEFADASKEYPIVFTPIAETQTLTPTVLLGVRRQENLYVQEDGSWHAGYIPAFVRRYPFVLAQRDGEKISVCIDEAYAGLNDEEGELLFDEEGKNTPFLQNALDFLHRFQQEHNRTKLFCDHLNDLGLFRKIHLQLTWPNNTGVIVNDLYIVDEQKLLQLPDKDALELLRHGEMGWIYAHLLSLSTIKRWPERFVHLQAENGETGLLPHIEFVADPGETPEN